MRLFRELKDFSQLSADVSFIFQPAFPKDLRLPAEFSQFLLNTRISLPIPAEFIAPKLTPCLWHGRLFAVWMLVPKTTVNKYCDTIAGENQVGRSWQIASMQSKPQTHIVGNRP